jgi:ribosome-associated protein
MAAKRPSRPSTATTAPRPAARKTAAAKPAAPRRAASARAGAKVAAKAKAAPARAAPARAANKRSAPASTARPAPAGSRRKAKAPPLARLAQVVLDALADMKAVDVKALDVRGITDITDTMVVASGTSDRHVKSIADRVVQRCKEAGFRPYGIEGERDGEWVLLDLNDVVLHVMLPRVREFYALEKLWEGGAVRRISV